MTVVFVPSFSGVGKIENDTVSFSKKDFLSLPEEEILKIVNETVNNPDNYIGSGREASVYRIGDEPYCVKIPHENKNKVAGTISFDLKPSDKVNHVVAKFSDDACIMTHLKGYSPYLFPLYDYDIEQADINKIIDEMPVSTFRNFIRQIGEAKQNGMIFDCGWGNVVINPQNKTITAIDFYEENENFYNDARILKACYASLIYPDAPAEHKKTCAAKLILAALEELKTGVKSCIDIRDINISGFLEMFYTEENQGYFEILKKVLQEIEILKLKTLYNKGTESSCSNTENELDGKIKVAESLTKQILLLSCRSNTIPVVDDKEICDLQKFMY